ncbi:MAG: glycosyl hydrolase family 18 protein [Clostridia bacterium]|nr:glycosyl hydrolase family 18 protein [Clostridia bacterium]
MQPNATATALVVLLYLASSLAGTHTSKTGSQVPTPPGVHTTQSTPQARNDAVEDMAGRSAAVSGTANVRSGPGTNYPKIASLPKNSPLHLLSEVNGWCQVSLPSGGYGWIARRLLTLGPDPSGSESASRGRDVVGYYTVDYPGDRSSYNVVRTYSGALTAIAPFSFSVDHVGNIDGQHSAEAQELAASRGLTNLALVHNLRGDSFNRSEISAMLNSKAARKRAAEGILTVLKTHHYDGVNIDFENVPPSDRAVLTQFMQELHASLSPLGYKVTMSAPAKHSDSPKSSWIGAFDYYQLGRAVDQFMIMTYDEHTSGTPAGPVASLPWVERVVKYATTQIPKGKILLGVAAYGYDWNTATNRARALTYSKAISTAAKHGKKVLWDNKAKTPYFRYTSAGVSREVWFESADSLSAKLDIVKKYDLGGIAIWRLGQEDTEYWKLIKTELIR